MADEEKALAPFLQLVSDLEDGNLLADANRQLTELVAAMAEHQRNTTRDAKGSLVLRIDFVDDGRIVEASCKIDTTHPKPVRMRSVLWRGRGNQLRRTNPAQTDAFDQRGPDRHLAIQ